MPIKRVVVRETIVEFTERACPEAAVQYPGSTQANGGQMARRPRKQFDDLTGVIGVLAVIVLGLVGTRGLAPPIVGVLLALIVALLTNYAWNSRFFGGAPGRKILSVLVILAIVFALGEYVWPRPSAEIRVEYYRTLWKDVAGGKQVFFTVTIINDGADATVQEYYQHIEGPTDDPYGHIAEETYVKPVVNLVKDRVSRDGGIAPTPMDAKASQTFTIPGPILPSDTQRVMLAGQYAIYIASGVLVRRADGQSSKVFCGVFQGGQVMGCPGAT